MRELEVENKQDILPKIRVLVKNQENKENSKIIECLTNLLINCAPEGYFDEKPPLSKVWKWLKTLLNEYMKLKRIKIENEHEKKIL
jgi:hypothetical protein